MSVDATPQETYILYKQRWLVLFGYGLLSACASQTAVCYPSVSSILQYYYNVDTFLVNTTSMIFAFGSIVFTFPLSYLLHKYELAIVMNFLSFTHVIGCIIRYFSTEESGFPLILVGVGFTSICYSGLLFLAPKVASNWFGQHELGRATSICVGLDLLHVGLSFLITTQFIRNHTNKSDIKSDLKNFAVYQLVLGIVTSVYIFAIVKSHPPTPPTLQEREKLEYKNRKNKLKNENLEEMDHLVNSEKDELSEMTRIQKMKNSVFLKSVFRLLKHRDFQLVLLMIGIAYSVEVLYETLLNSLFTAKFPGREKDIGILGCAAILLGFFTNLIMGTIIDKTKAYKQLSFGLFTTVAILGIIWTVLLEHSSSFIALSIVFCLFVGLNTTYYSIAFSHSAHILHPIATGTISMLLIVVGSVPMVPSVYASTYLLKEFGSLSVNILNVVLITIAAVLSLFVKNEKNSDIQALLQKEEEVCETKHDTLMLDAIGSKTEINS